MIFFAALVGFVLGLLLMFLALYSLVGRRVQKDLREARERQRQVLARCEARRSARGDQRRAVGGEGWADQRGQW